MLSRIGRWLAKNLVGTAALTAAMSLLWVFVVLHAGPLVPVLGWLDFKSASWLVFAAAAAWLHRRPNGFAGLYAIALAWLLLLFMQAFSTGLDTYCTAKILIPIGDSAGYGFEAARLAHGSLLSEWGGVHAISHSFFSALIFLFDNNLVLIHVTMGLLAALSLCLCTMAVRASWGGIAAAAFMAVCGQMFFYSIGTFATETYGLSMGLVGTALVLTGVRKESLPWQFCGLFALGVALSARAGAFFVLPLVGLAFASLQPTWRRRALVLGGAAACVVASLSLNAIATRLLCEPSATPLGMDFWHHLNGMLMGQSWNASIATHTQAQAKEAALRAIADNPWLLAQVSWKAVRFFFAEHTDFAFVFNRRLAFALTFLLAGGFVCCLVKVRERMHRAVLLALLGILLSIPFAPPWDAGIRVYAATMPLQVLGAVVFIGLLTSAANRVIPARFRPSLRPTTDTRPAFAFALTLAVLALGLMLPLAMVHTPLHLGKVGSAYYEGKMWVRLIPGNYLRIVHNGEAKRSYVPRIRRMDFLRKQPGFSYMFKADNTAIYSRMPAGVVVTRGDATGIVFIIKDDFGDKLPESVVLDATLVRLRGDNVAYDKRLNIDAAHVEAVLESVYLPWFTGYDYYYGYHAVLGSLTFLENTPGGKVTVQTQNFGTLETSREMFPRFRRQSDGKMLRLDMDAKTLTEDADAPGEEMPNTNCLRIF